MSIAWQGVFPASTTQFQPNQALDIPGTLSHLDRMIDAGIHGLIMLGTVGENCSLEYPEKLEVLRATVDHVAGKVPVLTGVAECTTVALASSRLMRSGSESWDSWSCRPWSTSQTLARRSRISGRSRAPRICRSWSITTRCRTMSISPPRCSSTSVMSPGWSRSRSRRRTCDGSRT